MKFLRALIPQNRLTTSLLSKARSSLGMVSDALPLSYYLSLIENRSLASRSGRMVIFVSMPKSGSTFIASKLAEYLGWVRTHLNVRLGSGETDVDPHLLIDLLQSNVVIRQHVLGTEGNSHYIFKYAELVVFQTRNIYETLLSFRRHLLGESLYWPFMTFYSSFRTLSPERQLDQIVDLVTPWMLNFYASWECHLRNPPSGVRLLHLDYREVATSELNALRRIIHELEGSCDEKRLFMALNKKDGKYRKKENDWIEQAEFNEDQLARIRRISSYFPETDFSLLGISN